MNANSLIKLESNLSFKKDYLNKTGWWKTSRIIPPIFFLFIGLFGLIYLLNLNKLISLNAIPFVLLFAIATLWLKTVKKYVTDLSLSVPGSFLACAAKAIETDGKYAYVVFVTDGKRHYEHNINKLAKEVAEEKLPARKAECVKKAVLVEDEASETNFYFKALKIKDILKQDKNWSAEKCVPIIYINDDHVYVIKKKYL